MDEWLSYRLSDLILFSPQAYFRMFAQYHERIAPLQVVLLSSAIAIPVLMRRSPARAERMIAAILAAWWLWVAIAFHLGRYATINWGARYFAILFMVQSVLLAWYSMRHRHEQPLPNHSGATLLFVLACAAPVASLIAGRDWNQVELIGATPDPTAIATLAFALSSARARWVLALIPVLWCAIGGATLWALDSAEAWVPWLAGIVAVALLFTPRRAPA
jgi:hypothetical protein